jgi:protocatechuate 3,4-dioxygenase beta subunit
MTRISACFVAALLTAAAVTSARQQPRDGATTTQAATATIRGRVTAAATDRPLHRVRITLNGALANPPTTVTDTRGIYELTSVPAGTYSITATRAGYLTLQYGQRRPREAGRTLDVKAGETIEGIDLALPKGSVIAGRITDELGEPAPGARVEATEFRYIRGQRVLVAARIATANDTGEYRLGGLEPGTYQVRATAAEVWESDDGQQTLTYAMTYYPGVTAAEQPQAVNVPLGQEVSGIDIRLVAGRAARVTGVVEGAGGEPIANQVVNLDNIGRSVGGALWFAAGAGSTRTDAQGAFEFPKLPPGEYMAYSGDQKNSVAVRAIVSDGDVQHIVLTPRRGTAIRGTVRSDEETPPPFPPARLRLLPISADPKDVLPGWNAARERGLGANWTFEVSEADGKYLFRVAGLPPDWMLKSVTLSGRDITDVPLTVTGGAADVDGVQVVFSRKGGRIAGDVVDSAGAAAPDTTVIVFPDDSALWGLASRYVKAARPDRAGRFTVGGLPAATYRVAALDLVIEGQWEDQEFLRSLQRIASRIQLGEGATETVKVTVAEAR